MYGGYLRTASPTVNLLLVLQKGPMMVEDFYSWMFHDSRGFVMNILFSWCSQWLHTIPAVRFLLAREFELVAQKGRFSLSQQED